MPADALPQPRPMNEPLPGAVQFTRRYADALGRPLSGQVTISPRSQPTAEGVTVAAAPVKAPLVDGLLDVWLPPGSYQLDADLRTADGAPASIVSTATVPEGPTE